MIKHQLPKENCLGTIEKIAFSEELLKKNIIRRKPTVFMGLIKYWPAYSSWNIDYLIKKCGKREIYVKNIKDNIKEISHFDDALNKIYHQYINKEKSGIVIQMAQIKTGKLFSRSSPCLEVLANDILIPSSVPKAKIVEVNFWAGSGQNTTELHYDPTDNLLSLIEGEKKIVIFPPTESKKLYNAPTSATKKSVTHSLVNIENIDISLYPKILQAKYYECSLSKGETLLLPSGYWHVVESINLNIAVNIWWLPKLTEFFKLPSRSFWLAEISSRIKGKGTCTPHSITKRLNREEQKNLQS